MIQIMHKQGYSKKRIARELGVSINTVRKYITADIVRSYSERPPKPMKLDAYRGYIKKRLEDSHPHWVPATVIYREIKARGYTGKESMLRRYMRQQKPVVTEENIRFETPSGQQMQVDWAQLRKGKNRLCAFVATLGYSRASYVEFVTDEKLMTLLKCHENAFDYFGGVPKEILYDNMKTVIIERDCYGEGKHRLQSGFWDFSKHYGFIPKVCRPYRPQTKGKVERFIHFLKYSFYYPLVGELKATGTIVDASMANYKVAQWLNEVANQRCHGTTGAIPFKRLQQEQLDLQKSPFSYVSGCIQTPYCAYSVSELALPEADSQHPLSIYDELLQQGASV